MRKSENFYYKNMNKDWCKGDRPQIPIQKNNSFRGKEKW